MTDIDPVELARHILRTNGAKIDALDAVLLASAVLEGVQVKSRGGRTHEQVRFLVNGQRFEMTIKPVENAT